MVLWAKYERKDFKQYLFGWIKLRTKTIIHNNIAMKQLMYKII